MSAGRGRSDAADVGQPTQNKPDLPDLRLIATALGCWFSGLAGLYLSAPVGWAVAGGAALAAGGAVGLTRGRWRWVVAAGLLGVACGAAACAWRVGVRDAEPLAGLVRDHTSVEAELIVSDDPRRAARAAVYVVPARLVGLSTVDGGRVEGGARVVILGTDHGWRGLLPGQRVIATGRLGAPRGGDLRAAALSVNGVPTPVGTPPRPQIMAGGLRAGLQRACRPLPPEPGGLLPGLVVGDTSRLDPALAEDFRATGLTHLTAVSGSNCAIVTGAVLLLARWCRAGPRLSAVLCAVALIGFVVLARPSPSVLRAASMGGIGLVALAVGRPRAALPALAAAIVALVVGDPELAGDPGFALSVLATAGLLLLAPRWSRALRSRGVPAAVAEALAIPAAAQVACAPVVAAISATVSLTAVPANLLAIPAVAPATIFGVATALVSPLWPGGAEFLAWLGSWPCRWLVAIAHTGAAVPVGLLPWPGGATGGVLLGALLAALLWAGRIAAIRRFVLVTTVAAILGATPIRIFASGWPPAGWLVIACDVGQGDAIVLATGPGQAVVVDAGAEPAPVDRCLRRLGISTVPALVVSHFHLDHAGGIEGVLRGRRVGELLTPTLPEPSAGRAAVLASAAAHGVPVHVAEPGIVLVVGGLTLSVLGPTEPLRGTRSDPNNNSVVLLAITGGRHVLLTGDAEEERQRELITSSAAVLRQVDVLKTAHADLPVAYLISAPL